MADTRTYIKVHDGMPDHPKVVGLSDAAFRLRIEALCYCSRHLTDGILSKSAMKRLAPPRIVRELEDAGLLVSSDEKWIIPDYLEHQRSADGVRKARDHAREAGRRGGLARAKQTAKQSAKQKSSTRLSKTLAVVKSKNTTEPSLRSGSSVSSELSLRSSSAEQARPTQRSKIITDAYVEAQPMSKWPAVNSVVLRAIKVGQWSDEAILEAMLRLAKEGRSVTVETLRVELTGFAPNQRPNASTAFAGAMARAEAAEAKNALEAK